MSHLLINILLYDFIFILPLIFLLWVFSCLEQYPFAAIFTFYTFPVLMFSPTLYLLLQKYLFWINREKNGIILLYIFGKEILSITGYIKLIKNPYRTHIEHYQKLKFSSR